MQAAQLALQPPHDGRERYRVDGVDAGLQIVEMTESADADPQAVQSVGARTAPGLAPCGTDPIPSSLLLLAEQRSEDGGSGRPRRVAEHPAQFLEQVSVPFGTQEHFEQFATRTGIIPEASPQPRDPDRVRRRRLRQMRVLDQGEHYVPVPDLADEAGEACKPSVERTQGRAVARGQQSFPQGQRVPEPAHGAMECVQALGSGMRPKDEVVDRTRDVRKKALDMPREVRNAYCRTGTSSGCGACHGRWECRRT